LIHKAKTEEPKTVLQQLQTGLTGEEHRSDRCATTQFGDFELRTRVGIARLASRLSRLRSPGIRLMEKT
jgi:hypothetical protein